VFQHVVGKLRVGVSNHSWLKLEVCQVFSEADLNVEIFFVVADRGWK
jgi:hypothetical protein